MLSPKNPFKKYMEFQLDTCSVACICACAKVLTKNISATRATAVAGGVKNYFIWQRILKSDCKYKVCF